MLARLFVIFGGLFVLALTAALVAPYVVDWSSYRADFEREASAILGRNVVVNGEATATLLPFPSVTFSNVEVGGGAGGEPAMTAETFSMDAEIAPLLSGEFRIFDMRLVRPKVIIDVAADGTIDWAVRPSTPIDASNISIEKLTVTEGQVSIRHAASGRLHRLTEINTEMAARSLAGPWRLVGSMRVDGQRTSVVVNTGRAAGGGMRLRIQADPEVQKVSIETEGELRFETGAAARYAGDFRLAARRDRIEQAGTAAADAKEPGFRIRGTFALDNERLALEEFRFETGPLDNPYSADGEGFVELGADPRFSLLLDGAQIRFDEAIGAQASGSLTVEKRIAALQETLLDLPRPSMPGNVEVSLPAVVAGDTTIRDVRLSASPASEGWEVRSLSATLPGRTTFEADGTLKTEGELGFSGSLLLAVGQPSGFAAWVAQDVDDAIRRLPAAGFRADVNLSERRQFFENLELGLGGATFRGKAERLHPRDARPATVLELQGDALDLDGLLAFASLFISDVGVNRFAGGDLDLDVKAGPVSSGELAAGSIDAALRLRDGLIEIDRFSVGDLAGATLSATGTIRDLPENPSGSVDVSLVATDLAPLIGELAEHYGGNPIVRGLQERATAYRGLFRDSRLDVVATAAGNDDGTTGVAVSAQGTVGGTALSATLSGKGWPQWPESAQVSVAVSGRNDDAAALLALYGLPVLPLGLTGGGQSDLTLKGTLSEGLATSLSLDADDFLVQLDGTTRLSDGVAIRGKARLDAPDIEPLLMTTGVVLPAMGAGMPVDLAAEIDYGNGALALDGLTGTVNQGAVAGTVSASLQDGKPHFTGNLVLDELNLEPLAAMVLGEPALESVEQGWSSVPFTPRVSAPFSAELAIDAATVAAGPALTAYDAKLNLRLDAESLLLSDLSARLYGGGVEGLFELKNSGGTGLLSAQMKLNDADIASVLGAVGLNGTGDLSAALSASGKSVGGLVATLSGSGTAAFRSLVVDGVNPDALAGFIERADRIGRDIDAARTAAFAPAIASAGRFEAGPGEAAFTVAGGVLRAPPLKLKNSAAAIEANMQADFNKGEVTVTGTLRYEPGNEALVGSEPALRFALSGPPEATTRSFDSVPLAQFLTQRALEMEQARVEAMQAGLLEKQRLRREVRYYSALQEEHGHAVDEQRRSEAETRQRQEAEQARKEAAERQRLEEEQRAAREAGERARQETEAGDAQTSRDHLPANENVSPTENIRPTLEIPPADGFMRMLQGE